MSQFLQQTPHLGYSLELIELAIYRENPEDDQTLFIQPRIVARTKEITRAIVEIRTPISSSDISVRLPNEKKLAKSPRRKESLKMNFWCNFKYLRGRMRLIFQSGFLSRQKNMN